MRIYVFIFLFHFLAYSEQVFDIRAIRDPSTLEIEVLKDWYVVAGPVKTRQKLITIHVGEFWPGKPYRVPVRMVVPHDLKAKGIHLTGGNRLEQLKKDMKLNSFDAELIRHGIGFVQTVVQVLQPDQYGNLGQEVHQKFIETLNPRYALKYWGWPASLMRSVTAAHAEKEYFEVGKVAMSGGSKNGASPSAALIHDDRLTAVHASVSPIYESPLRLANHQAWDELEAYDQAYLKNFKPHKYSVKKKISPKHTFLGGAFGPIYNYEALEKGHTWKELQELAKFMKKTYFISQHLEELKARNVDLWFEPGTHDFVAYDLAHGGKHYPQIPMYLKANSGHGIKANYPPKEKNVQNKQAWLLEHFFEEVDDLLVAPKVLTNIQGNKLMVEVKFPDDNPAETGRIYWIYNRGPDGSLAYINELIPDDQYKDMNYDKAKQAWIITIDLDSSANKIDFFSNHKKTINFKDQSYNNYISSPYQSLKLK